MIETMECKNIDGDTVVVFVIPKQGCDEVLLAIKRPEGYEDVIPELLVEDAIRQGFEYRIFPNLLENMDSD